MCLSKFVCSSICLFVSFSVCLFVSLWFWCSSTAQHFLVIISGFCHEGPWIRIRTLERIWPKSGSSLNWITIVSCLNRPSDRARVFFMVGSGLDFFLRVGSESDLPGSPTLWCKGCYKRNWFVLWRVCLTQERGCTFRRGPFF